MALNYYRGMPLHEFRAMLAEMETRQPADECQHPFDDVVQIIHVTDAPRTAGAVAVFRFCDCDRCGASLDTQTDIVTIDRVG